MRELAGVGQITGRCISCFINAGMVAVLLAVYGCAASEPERPLNLPPGQNHWLMHAGNPIVRGGDFREKSLWNDPSVLKTGDGYVMYMTTSTKEPFKPPVLPFRAVSKDGIKWRLEPDTPLMDTSGTSFVSIETPSVVFFKNQYHMYFSGRYKPGKVPPIEIGYATSPDGIHWTKDSKPVITSSGKVSEWTGFAVAEPGAVVFNDKIYLYFAAMGARPSGSPPQLQNIGLATSSDGRNFDAPRIVLSQSNTYPPQAGFPGYSTPSALVDGGTIHLFYDVVHFQKNAKPEWRQVAIHRAVSKDGGLSFVEDRQPVLRRNDTFWTATGEILGPTAIVDGNEVKLWFSGHSGYDDLGKLMKRGWKGPEFGIGLVTTSLAQLRNAKN